MPDESSIFWKAGEALKEHLGSVSLFASRDEMLDNKARIHAFEAALINSGISIGSEVDINMASKVSLGVVSSALQSLIDLRATTVSLGNAQVSLANAKSELESLIDLRATHSFFR